MIRLCPKTLFYSIDTISNNTIFEEINYENNIFFYKATFVKSYQKHHQPKLRHQYNSILAGPKRLNTDKAAHYSTQIKESVKDHDGPLTSHRCLNVQNISPLLECLYINSIPVIIII